MKKILQFIISLNIACILAGCEENSRLTQPQKNYIRATAFLHGVLGQVEIGFAEDTALRYTNIDVAIRDLDKKHTFEFLKIIGKNQGLLFNPDVRKWKNAAFVNTFESVKNEPAIFFDHKHSKIDGINDAFLGITFGGKIIMTNEVPMWPSLKLE